MFFLYLLLRKVTKTTDEAGKSNTLKRLWMLSENVFFSKKIDKTIYFSLMQKPEFKHREFESKWLPRCILQMKTYIL